MSTNDPIEKLDNLELDAHREVLIARVLAEFNSPAHANWKPEDGFPTRLTGALGALDFVERERKKRMTP